MKEDARKRKAAELEKKMQDFQKQGADAEKQLHKFQESQLAPLFQKLEGRGASPWPSRKSWTWSWTSAMPGSSIWIPSWISPIRYAAKFGG